MFWNVVKMNKEQYERENQEIDIEVNRIIANVQCNAQIKKAELSKLYEQKHYVGKCFVKKDDNGEDVFTRIIGIDSDGDYIFEIYSTNRMIFELFKYVERDVEFVERNKIEDETKELGNEIRNESFVALVCEKYNKILKEGNKND